MARRRIQEIAVHTYDAQVTQGGRTAAADAESGDMGMRGAASELVLYCSARVPLDGLETTGDTGPMEQLADGDPNA